MYRTPEHVAAVLSRVDRPIQPRTLSSWIEKGLLPRLAARGRGQAKGKLYYWPQRDIVHQAGLVYDLLSWRPRVDEAQVMLWLLGYDVAVEQWIRPRFLQMFEGIDELLDEGSLGEDAEEKRLDRLSELAIRNSTRSRHSPRQDRYRHIIANPLVNEIYLNVLLNRAYEPSRAVLADVADVLAPSGHAGSTGQRSDETTGVETPPDVRRWLSFAAQHLSLPSQRDAAALATPAEWHRAQRDFQRVLAPIVRLAKVQNDDLRDWGGMRFNLVAFLGIHLVLADLALRRAGYAERIDWALQFTEFANQYLDTHSREDVLAMASMATEQP